MQQKAYGKKKEKQYPAHQIARKKKQKKKTILDDQNSTTPLLKSEMVGPL